MWHRIKDLWRHNRASLVAFVVVLGIAGFFGARSLSEFIYWSDPARQEQPLAGWMTPRYVSQSYQVPREVIQSAFGLSSDSEHRRVSLYSLAAENETTLAEMQAALDAAVAAWRAQNPQPRP